MKILGLFIFMSFNGILLHGQYNIHILQGSYLSGECGETSIQGGMGGGPSLYGQCGALQFLPPWVNDDVISSISDLDAKGIWVYPNPSDGWISVHSGRPVQSIQLYSSMGRLIRNIERPIEKTDIDLSGHNPGMYFLKIYTNDHTYTISKIILKTN